MGDLMIRDFYLPDATLSVVRDPVAKENRIMLLSHCTSIGVCMKCEASAPETIYHGIHKIFSAVIIQRLVPE